MRLRYQFEFIQLIRNYFCEQGFLEVITPPAVENPGMEVHIHPFQLHSTVKKRNLPLYLHTSPEFCMKELLSSREEKLDNIFQVSYCFRDEPHSPVHREQFLMLEWYRRGERYEKIMEDVDGLISSLIQHGKNKGLPLRPDMKEAVLIRKTMSELFREETGIEILDYLDVSSIKKLLLNLPEVPVPAQDLEWDDYFFLIYLNLIEPKLKKYPLLLISEFPAPLSALSTIKVKDPRVCERFEVYVNGIELCNAFNELTDAVELKRRFNAQNELKQRLYGYGLPEAKQFYATMDRGLPPSSGVALGVERLLHSLFDISNPFYC